MIDRGHSQPWQARTERWSALKEDVAGLEDDARHLARSLEKSLRSVGQATTAQVRAHPVATLGAAAGVGYVLGGGLPSSLTKLLWRIGSRAALNLAVSTIVAQLQVSEMHEDLALEPDPDDDLD